MRYVIARQTLHCVVCKSPIPEGTVCIQSLGIGMCFYHQECHDERFGASIWHLPKMTKTVEKRLEEVKK